MNTLILLFFVLSISIFSLGLLSLLYFPLSLYFELRRRRPPVFETETPLVSVVVPAYNEGKVIANCIESILADDYPNKEIILVDDGSTDDTLAIMQRYAHLPNVIVMGKHNGGKAAALNCGIQYARGEILFFVDSDGIFAESTIREMLKGFDSLKVGAVCGSDEPVNLDRPQLHLAALCQHVGTGFVRRALAAINCLPIVSGNIGAFRRSVLLKTGYFREGFIGEDLELTWRVHRAGYRVNFQPHAIVYAEAPSTLHGLWKQRVRWARGLIQTVRLHQDMFFNPRYGLFGFFLPLNVANMLLIPVLQLLVTLLLPILVLLGHSPVSLNLLSIIGWIGLGMAFVAACYSIALDRAWGDFKYLYALPLWFPYSLFMNVVAVWALILEVRGGEAHWNKLERTGTVSRGHYAHFA
jgi:biofilm PGA synthesis N-glycosyltransferase PgaC